MSKNLRGNIEAKKQDSTKANTINAESSTLESNIDSNNDEIVYEIWHNPTWWDYAVYFIALFLGIAMVYGGIEAFLFNKIEKPLLITSLIFGIPFTLISSYHLLYIRKNRFCVTNSGMGFERRNWFRMQRDFIDLGRWE